MQHLGEAGDEPDDGGGHCTKEQRGGGDGGEDGDDVGIADDEVVGLGGHHREGKDAHEHLRRNAGSLGCVVHQALPPDQAL